MRLGNWLTSLTSCDYFVILIFLLVGLLLSHFSIKTLIQVYNKKHFQIHTKKPSGHHQQ